MFLQPFYLAILKNNLNEFLHPLKVEGMENWLNVMNGLILNFLYLAIDIDQINTTNSMVNYEILQGNFEDMFDIEKNTGNIFVKPNQLTQLNIPNHIVLTVRAYDLGIPQMSSLVKVFIYVLVNMNI